ncbi:4Fe-4S dicluster domain-containing protein [Vulcanisaeta sp. JCM 14467]|uniref:4Fe-4S dicluster domain-containing protein n=1 Tax=Vulcanisaeta sp. JCM 14467 TaxID=1295370 RepID=UPI000AA32965|nr:4Fe-4S dicluster domain-containing protein [Vulcanisaeta sp. JCM 14467]
MAKVNPKLIDELKELGAFDISACYSCGVCTATCPLAQEGHEFPRKIIRYAILGLEDKLISSTEPWLCYYCGECTQSCPRGADPAGFMMAVRRYLTTHYDFTGFSRRFYRSKVVELISTILLFTVTVLSIYLVHGPIILTRVDLDSFLPPHIVELGDIVILVVLSALLLTNVYRMYRLTVMARNIPFTAYIKEFVRTVVPHFLTQIRMLKCNRNTLNWIMHILIVYGYATIFIFVVVFLDLFQTNVLYPIYSPIRLGGYIASAALLIGAGYAIYGRLRKDTVMRQYSHSTDWFFLTLLYLVVITGVLIDAFKYMGLPMETYIAYTVHLGLVTPLLVLEVPFAKWSHLAYRPFAIYFTRLNDLSKARTVQVTA